MVERAIEKSGSSNICKNDKVCKRNNNFKKYRKVAPKNIKVVNTVLLYSIADAGFLHTILTWSAYIMTKKAGRLSISKTAWRFKTWLMILTLIHGWIMKNIRGMIIVSARPINASAKEADN